MPKGSFATGGDSNLATKVAAGSPNNQVVTAEGLSDPRTPNYVRVVAAIESLLSVDEGFSGFFIKALKLDPDGVYFQTPGSLHSPGLGGVKLYQLVDESVPGIQELLDLLVKSRIGGRSDIVPGAVKFAFLKGRANATPHQVVLINSLAHASGDGARAEAARSLQEMLVMLDSEMTVEKERAGWIERIHWDLTPQH